MASGPDRVQVPEAASVRASQSPKQSDPAQGPSGVRQSLRGKGYDEQVAMLSPRGAGGGSRPTLRVGQKSAAVVDLQQSLNATGAGLAADGAFGPATLRAVKDFQRAGGLSADGVVGPKTWARLDAGDVAVGGAAGGGAAGGGGPAAAGPGQAAKAAVLAKVQQVHARLAVLSSGAGRDRGSAGSGAVPQEPAPRAGWTDDLADAAGDAYDAASDAVGGAADAVADTASDVVDTVADTVKDVAAKVADTVGGVADTVAQTVADATGGGDGGAAPEGDSVVPDPAAAWDLVVSTASRVKDEAEAYADGLRQDYGSQIDAFLQALNDLGRPLTVDLDAVGATLDQILGGLDATNGLDVVTPLVSGPPPVGAITFEFKEPRKRSVGVSEPDFYLFRDKLGALTSAQMEGGKGSVLFVLPDTPTVKSKKVEGGQVTKVTLQTQDEEVTPHWTEYNADKTKYHPLQQKAWETAHDGMVGHEDGHVAIDAAVFNTSNIQDLYGKPESAIVDKINELVADGDARNAVYDAGNSHGINGTPSTQIGSVSKGDMDGYDEEQKKKKEGKK
jgi:hypothetical protein